MNTKGSAAVFRVVDLERALRFYTGVLGFAETFRYGAGYAGVEHGEVQIHFATDTHKMPPGKSQVYVFCDDVDAYYAEIVGKGAVVPNAPQSHAYGMRDFDLADPDGNLLTFGMES